MVVPPTKLDPWRASPRERGTFLGAWIPLVSADR